MYIKEYENIEVEITSLRKLKFIKSLTNEDVILGKTYKIHWSLLNRSSIRREKIKLICDGCNNMFSRRIFNLKATDLIHFCNSCGKSGNKNPMFNKTNTLHHNYGIKRPDMLGDKNNAKTEKVRELISKYKRMDVKEFINRCDIIHENKYDYSQSTYINNRTKIIIICPIHGEFTQQPQSHIKGSGCNKCRKISVGEYIIEKILIDNKIEYVKQKMFNDCRGIKRPLPFDFYIPEHNTCIEYDGRQHFEMVEKFGGLKQFNITLRNDRIKYTEDINLDNLIKNN